MPGGLIGVGTRVDPTLCRADRLVGFVLGLKGHLPDIFVEIEINYFLLRRLLGVKTSDGKQAKVTKLAKGEILMVNIGSSAIGAKVIAVKADAAILALTTPACTTIGEKIALSRRIEKHWRLIGWANIVQYVEYALSVFFKLTTCQGQNRFTGRRVERLKLERLIWHAR